MVEVYEVSTIGARAVKLSANPRLRKSANRSTNHIDILCPHEWRILPLPARFSGAQTLFREEDASLINRFRGGMVIAFTLRCRGKVCP
jgi:hypothetical protein